MRLPDAFKDKMLELLGESEYVELIEALNGQRQHGLRVNTLKVGVEEFLKLSPFRLEAVPWTADGFYIAGEDAPGRHPYYHAGLYYIQEPSAMLPGAALDAQPGEKVLDLCAAPGGKTVQIAAAMKGRGLLFSNDINADRVKALVKNIELCGVRNAIVLNESPSMLACSFEGYFDRVLIDAPCSGEGMFRKDETAARSWESFKCERCAKMQEQILNSADRLLKPGGTLVYSTCTFSPEENEQMIVKFMQEHEGYELVEIPKMAGIEGGRPQWVTGVSGGSSQWAAGMYGGIYGIREMARRMARLWPHRVRGEGHFVAKLVKVGVSRDACGSRGGAEDLNAERLRRVPAASGFDPAAGEYVHAAGKLRSVPAARELRSVPAVIPYEKLPGSFREFISENIAGMPEGIYFTSGNNLYHLPELPPGLDGLKVAKFGWFLGSFDGSRFEPSHSLVTALGMNLFKRVVNLDAESEEVKRYLRGETLMMEGDKGYTAVCVDGFTLGWAKQTGGMLKNLYPKGWRKLN